MVLADTALLDSLTLEAQLPLYWVPVLGSLYILILSAVSITQEPTRCLPGLLGLVKFLLALPCSQVARGFITHVAPEAAWRNACGLGSWRTEKKHGAVKPTLLFLIYGGFPKLGVPFWIIRTTVLWGLYWGPPYFGKLPFARHFSDNVQPRTPTHGKVYPRHAAYSLLVFERYSSLSRWNIGFGD